MKKSDLHFRFISLFPICNSFSTHFMGFIYVIMSYAVIIRQIVTIIQKQPVELFCKKKVFLNFFLRAGFSDKILYSNFLGTNTSTKPQTLAPFCVSKDQPEK